MKGKIVYRFETPAYPGNILYVNLIQNYACTNNCRFCSRPRRKEDYGKPTIYEKKAGSFLHLERSPDISEIVEEISRQIKPSDSEIAIIGLGEPLLYLDKVLDLIRSIKDEYRLKVRIDTNGLVGCTHPGRNPAKELKEAGLDDIRISLNAINSGDYKALCRPRFKGAFESLCDFVTECIRQGINTRVSFVVGFPDPDIRERTREEYLGFASRLGVKKENVIFREYIPPLG